jgi:hypothetical protein
MVFSADIAVLYNSSTASWLSFHDHIEQPWPLSVGSFSLLVPALGHQPMVPFAGFCLLAFHHKPKYGDT